MPTFYVLGRKQPQDAYMWYLAKVRDCDNVLETAPKTLPLTYTCLDWRIFEDAGLAFIEAECLEQAGHHGFRVYPVDCKVSIDDLHKIMADMKHAGYETLQSFPQPQMLVGDPLEPPQLSV